MYMIYSHLKTIISHICESIKVIMNWDNLSSIPYRKMVWGILISRQSWNNSKENQSNNTRFTSKSNMKNTGICMKNKNYMIKELLFEIIYDGPGCDWAAFAAIIQASHSSSSFSFLVFFGWPLSALPLVTSPAINPNMMPNVNPTINPTIIPSVKPTATPTAIPNKPPTPPPTNIPTSGQQSCNSNKKLISLQILSPSRQISSSLMFN